MSGILWQPGALMTPSHEPMSAQQREVQRVQIAEHVDTLVTNLATLTGQQFRTYISVHSSLRAKLAHDQRRLN